MPTLDVLDARGAKTGSVALRAEVFGGEARGPLLHQAVVRELADRRVGSHDTRGRSEVSGGGKKPWRQKGTGRARQGSIRATQWKGGGKPFGPTPRSYDKDLPRAMRRAALRDAVAARIADGAVRVVESPPVAAGKTKELVTWLRGLGLTAAPTVLVLGGAGQPLLRAARNVPWLEVEAPAHVSVYQLLRARQVVFERAALLALEEALAP
jgi:large subunit ribosomal protein L4